MKRGTMLLVAAVAVGVPLVALGFFGQRLYEQPWFWFWTVTITITSVVLAIALRSDGFRDRNQPHSTLQNILIAAGLLISVAAGFFGIGIDPELNCAGTVESAALVALGLLAAGIVVGFLFGLPKVSDGNVSVPPTPASAPSSSNASSAGAGAQPPATGAPTPFDGSRLRPNTNLEKVSDWLTTVITGLALTQLREVPTLVGKLATFLSKGLDGSRAAAGPNDHDPLMVISLGIILHFPLTGFLVGYITTRLILTRAFDAADRSLISPDEKQKVNVGLYLFEDKLGEFGAKQPSPGDRNAAERIVAIDPATLVTSEEKATYARAHSVLGNYTVAIQFYQAALVLDPHNARLLEQYAAALYAQDNVGAFQMIPPLETALELTDADDPAYARISTNLALAYLYVNPDGYLHTLRIADGLIANPNLDKKPSLFFYRACAYGQLYAAIRAGRTYGAEEVSTTDLPTIGERIESDTLTALNMQPSLERNFIMVASGPAEKLENDLIVYAGDHPAYLDTLSRYSPTAHA